MANKKMTVAEQFSAIQKMLNGEVVEDYTIEDAVAFLGTRIEQTAKKNASKGGEKKLTKAQLENEGIKTEILDALTNGRMSVGEVMKAVGIESNQKITSLLTQLRKVDAVVRTEEKGVAYYALPSVED